MEPPLCVVSNWIIEVYTILVWNTISGSSNLDICCYHCLILTLIFHLKVLINFFFFFIIIIIIIIIIITIIVVVIVLLLTIIYTINLSVDRPRSCRVIYYFDTPALGRRHQSFGRVTSLQFRSYFWIDSLATCETIIAVLFCFACFLVFIVSWVIYIWIALPSWFYLVLVSVSQEPQEGETIGED